MFTNGGKPDKKILAALFNELAHKSSINLMDGKGLLLEKKGHLITTANKTVTLAQNVRERSNWRRPFAKAKQIDYFERSWKSASDQG